MRDLTQEVTVFVISAGKNPNLDCCLKALSNQTVKFKLERIQDVYPLSKAFQQMIDKCQTPYYVEVDEDMVLSPNAIETLYDAGQLAPIACFMLMDSHLDMPIYGVKIYRTEVLKQFPYNLDHPSCEVEQLARMESAGWSPYLCTDVLGFHSPLWSNELIFERYRNLMEKFKLYHYIWMEKIPQKLFNIFKAHPCEQNLFALLGAFSSIYQDKAMEKEKDVRLISKDFRRAESYFSGPTQATLYMTSRCNFKCSWCYRQHHDIEQAPDMDIGTAQKLLTRFPGIKGVCICGYGEPLMSENLFPVIDYLNRQKVTIGLITNGSLITKVIDQFATQTNRPHYVSVSLNAPNREIHRQLSGVDCFDGVITGIQQLLIMGIPVYCSYVCTKNNLEHVPEFLKLVKGIGVQTVHLHNVLPHFNALENKGFEQLVLTEEDYHLIQLIKELPEADIVKLYPRLIKIGEETKRCQFPWKMIGMNGNGSLSNCNSVYPARSENGKIDDFVVWHSEGFEKFRDKFMIGELSACKLCFRNWEVV